MITAAMRLACRSAMPTLSKARRCAARVFEVGRRGGAVADCTDDNCGDALGVLAIN
jgi:hypothetical protein